MDSGSIRIDTLCRAVGMGRSEGHFICSPVAAVFYCPPRPCGTEEEGGTFFRALDMDLKPWFGSKALGLDLKP